MTTDYDAIPALNWSKLKLLATSPKLLKLRADEPRKDTPALRLGRAIHCAILEPERWARDYVGQPDFGDGRTKAAKLAKADWMDSVGTAVEILTLAEHATASRCAAEVRAHPKAAELLAVGRAEETITWKDELTGLDCKARLDWLAPTFVLDVKSSRHQTIRQMVADFARYLYHGQLAWYRDGAQAARAIPADAPPPRVIIVQTAEPFDVVPAQLSDMDLTLGRGLYRKLIGRYVECKAADWWPGLAPEMVELDLPSWTEGGEDETRGDDW